ncbi:MULTISPECIES: SusC/RagA family TonB-linked outer membrane protein [Mesoflavibacter]|uniref:SusC/RagA family TonB-linked outer membrane protein n=1 Tax=Mesoflavibacter TaxID=444051 RepID=UPI000D0F7D50|nr:MULTISPECIES: SusC/RagA family TonB-linked outer membrane protein [Mesoflavibacter]QIJ89478.1 Outer membrane TonB-dependent transporter [Mesoflavibacter sp. HG96]QIJ92206.1 Outer membrane TonB-dependent transporter [Mesoflavibacter sp. HG37]
MKTKFSGILTLFLAFIVQLSFAQEKTVSGVVSDENGLPLPSATVSVKGTSNGTTTDFDGNYSISVNNGQVLAFSYVGYGTKEVTVESSNTINVSLQPDNTLDEVVVTALGIKREKKSLGYATQEVSGDEVSKVKASNFVNSLSGKVAGLDIKSSGTLGGSTNVVIRGNSSIAGNNQALFVIDGIPIDNGNSNSSGQVTGRGGYDYGNAASDINPDDIESINILKGAAATALYGSRASNGVVMITTKRGQKRKGIGVTVTSSYMVTSADKETLPVYQKEYGAGYGQFYDDPSGYFGYEDIDGDGNPDLTTPFTEDASYGAAFDPSLQVFQWNSIYPQLDTYQQASPWVAGENDPNYVWKSGATRINSVSLDGGTDKSTFRLGITNLLQEGNLPNSEIKRNTINFSGSQDLTDKLTASTTFTYTNTGGKGRYGTGYDANNVMQQFRQWWQVNVDVAEQEQAYFATGDNITWNPNSSTDLSPIYSDNPYWTFYENYQTDERNRYFGNLVLDYEINDWLSVLGRFTFDTYSELQEERTNVGSANVSSYSRYNNNVSEYNYDLILNFNRDLTEKLNLDGNLGFNLRVNERNSIFAQTNGGLNLAGLYALSNSVNPINAPSEYEAKSKVDGLYARASLGYDGFAYLEGTYRRDRSSTLPIDNNTYGYFSITGSLLFSQLFDAEWLSFGKIRGNYAEVGSDTNPYRVFNTYGINTPFNGTGSASNPSAKNNLNLRPERQENWEIGLEMQFLNRRLGFDVSYYDTMNIDQITSVPVSNSTGYSSVLLNAGTISNKGWEVQLNGRPLQSDNFKWDVNLNWAKNESLVVSLADGIDNLQLGSFQGGVSLNATPGQPYGIIRGTNLVYHENGQPIVGTNGYYLKTATNNEIIGDINPDWTAGIHNSFTYKNINLSFLIDIQKGGDVFSLDTWYGYGTGLYDFTAGLNDLGNPVRNPVTTGADSGGVILPGVQADGSTNDVRAYAGWYANPWGWARAANKQHVYDAGFVKLREASITYSFTDKMLDKLPFTNASLSLIGRNLWIIDKNVPYADPEAGLSSGNIQGYQSGSYPSIREIGASLKLQF